MSNFFITLCCLLASIHFGGAFSIEEFKQGIMAAGKECQSEAGATDADLEDVFNNLPAAGLEGRCLHACVMKKFGFMNPNGKLAKEFALDFANLYAADDPDLLRKANELVEHCTAISVSDDHCEAVEEYKSCIRHKAEELHIHDMEF